MKKYHIPNTRLGGTSFIIHADYITGVRYTAEHCDDVALLLTCVGDNEECLIKRQEVSEIAKIIDGEGASLHIHLPTDGHCATKKDCHIFYKKIETAIDRAAILAPHTFVLHLDIIPLRDMNSLMNKEQEENIIELLKNIEKLIPNSQQLALENLESFPLNFWDNFLKSKKYSRCFDIGHIWKDGKNPLHVIDKWQEDIRLIHLHGMCPRYSSQNTVNLKNIAPNMASVRHLFGKKVRDHKSLAHIPNAWLDASLHPFWEKNFKGVINLEIFNPEEFEISHHCVLQSRLRFEEKK